MLPALLAAAVTLSPVEDRVARTVCAEAGAGANKQYAAEAQEQRGQLVAWVIYNRAKAHERGARVRWRVAVHSVQIGRASCRERV